MGAGRAMNGGRARIGSTGPGLPPGAAAMACNNAADPRRAPLRSQVSRHDAHLA